MIKKSESYFKDFLKNTTNEQLVQFYDDVEWTPFPVLVIKEYQNRFKAKNKKEAKEVGIYFERNGKIGRVFTKKEFLDFDPGHRLAFYLS